MQENSIENSDILTEKKDILIALTAYLENSNKNKLTIRYTDLDDELKIVKGSSKEYLKDVLEETGFEIDDKTDFQIVLIRKQPPAFMWLDPEK